ncbi:poly-beta-1,6-N-acetyl-D-glucosamine N-deacetylase PgaB [Deltaproteobacteria bacterium]|nr:poly-beta-1,6-N-acetyl-D-glucosamine N-deacetylase PgaB [Deltaproteobacteria bacterium]
MHRHIFLLIVALLLVATPVLAEDFLVLCYHGVEDRVTDDPDAMTVSSDNLVAHLNWLQEHGWTAISLEALRVAKAGGKPLPEKAFLLTFDDGYANVYRRVFPILKAFKVPAVLALVTSWLDTPEGGLVSYGTQQLPREYFMSWTQIREMVDSGLVEIASHSHNLHRGVLGNPQGNEQPALTTHQWLAEKQRYETDSEWRKRIRSDLQRSVKIIKKRLGKPPKVMVWPYGQYSRPAIEIAADLGMEQALTLDTAYNDLERLDSISRLLILRDPGASDLSWQIRHRFDRKIRRVAHVDLDYVYDADPQQQHRNLSLLLDRIRSLQINTVFLQAYADPDGDGGAGELYFPNRHLPVRADLFSRASWQLRTRANVDVFAWLPMLAFEVDGGQRVQRLNPQTGQVEVDPVAHQRLSPFITKNRKIIGEIYEDLAKHAHLDGILFSDDGHLSDYEDAGSVALTHYRQAWDLSGSIAEIRADKAASAAWSSHKTAELINLTGQLMTTVRNWRPQAESARNLYALPVLQPQSESWFAQSLPSFAAAYDWVAIMAMPWMEKAEQPDEWLVQLVDQVKRHPGVLDKTIFELQAIDWSAEHRKIPTGVLARQMGLLLQNGAVSFGYYPDEFVADHPNLEGLREAISLREYPYPRP